MKYFQGELPELQLKYKKGTIKKFKVSSSQDAYTGLKVTKQLNYEFDQK